jgi:hypothetical protein
MVLPNHVPCRKHPNGASLRFCIEVTCDIFEATLAPPARHFKSMSYVLAAQTDVGVLSAAIDACARPLKLTRS